MGASHSSGTFLRERACVSDSLSPGASPQMLEPCVFRDQSVARGRGGAETCGRARKGRRPMVSDPGGTGASGMSSPSLEASRQRRNVRLGVTPVPLFIPQCPHARSTGRLCPPGLGEQTPGRCVCAHTRDSGALRACARPRLWRGKSPPVPWGLGLSLALAPGLQLSRWVQGLS